ncbi:MAG: cupin domain-containing protein [Pseudomonadota bacterium]
MSTTAAAISSINADNIYEPFSTDDVPWEEFAQGDKFASRFKRLGKFGGGSHVGVALEELAPGKRSCPNHYHMLEEEHIYILDGELTLHLGGASPTSWLPTSIAVSRRGKKPGIRCITIVPPYAGI